MTTFLPRKPCPRCNGTGRAEYESGPHRCGTCGGSGTITDTDKRLRRGVEDPPSPPAPVDGHRALFESPSQTSEFAPMERTYDAQTGEPVTWPAQQARERDGEKLRNL